MTNHIFNFIIAALFAYVAFAGLGLAAAICTFIGVLGALTLILTWFIQSSNNLRKVFLQLQKDIRKNQ